MEIDRGKEEHTFGYTEADMKDSDLMKMERNLWTLIGEILMIVCTALGLSILAVLYVISGG